MEGKRTRKPVRLKDHDYSADGVYFATFCTKEKQYLLSKIVARGALAPPDVVLLEPGVILDGLIQNIANVYSGVIVERYVIMPNHVHLLLHYEHDGSWIGGARAPRATERSRPSVMALVGGLKSMTQRKVSYPLWQTSFHDHIIRNEQDYQRIWTYIDKNPAKWGEDIFFAG